MNRPDAKRLEDACWKVTQVLGDDHVRANVNSCGKDMTVIQIWQVQGIDMLFITAQVESTQGFVSKSGLVQVV